MNSYAVDNVACYILNLKRRISPCKTYKSEIKCDVQKPCNLSVSCCVCPNRYLIYIGSGDIVREYH